jgi:hypothetical protein
MNGNWSELPGESFEEKSKNAQKIVEEIKDNPEWVQVGSNPYRHSYFYDRNNGVPVTNAEEVVQIGGLVYAKNVTYGDVNSPEFTVKGLKDAAGNPVQFSILGDMYSKIPNAYQNIWDEMYVNTYEDVLSKGLPISTVKVLIDQEARNKGVSVDEPILSKGIDKDAELIPVSELESFVGEFRAGKDKMVNSSETINKLKEDISKNGFKESIIVQYTKDGEASIVEGNHRFQAAKELGLSKIPVTFKRVDKLPNNVSSDFLNVSIKDNFSKTGADLGFTSYKITPYDYKGSSRLSTKLSSEVYNPRSGESKEDYIERMREEIEANLLGENSEAYFERIATENNLTEEAKKSFKEKLKKFVKILSDWLARQLGFNNITPAEAAKLTTTDVLDRVTTSMLRGDFRPEEFVKNKLKNAKAKASELQASKDSGLEIITPVDLQNIEECT